jgi:peptidoglycan/xylan/chitin deacetylase (PgdA/CDA1 family)
MLALRRRLDAAAEAGRPVRFWLRDDDAQAPTAALERLLDLCAGRVPLTLAVIPAGAGAALADRLAGAAGVSVAVHGWSHANHARPWEKPQELGDHRPAGAVAGELARGLARLEALFGGRALPLLVPPWNRVAPGVLAALRGFRAVSVYGPERPGPLPSVNVQVDVIDWRGDRGGRPDAALESEILARVAGGGAVGVMTHHLVHDAAAWGFVERLFALTCGHPGAAWMTAADLMAGTARVSTPR